MAVKRTAQQDTKDKLLREFDRFTGRLNGNKVSFVHNLRTNAIKQFEKLGFPHKKAEDWKYTNLRPILKHDFQPVFESGTPVLQSQDLEKYSLPGMKVNQVVLYNGCFAPSLSRITEEDRGVTIKGLKEAERAYPELVGKHLGRYADYKQDGMIALSTAFTNDGLFVHVPRGTKVKHPVHVVYLNDGNRANVLLQPRTLFVVEESGELDIVETYHTLGSHYTFLNHIIEIDAGPNAAVQHYRLQNDRENAFQVASVQARQQRDSRFTNSTITFGGSFTRNTTNVNVEGVNCQTNLYGLYQVAGDQFADNHTAVDHKERECESNELYKGIMDDRSTGVFNGKVFVRQDAQKINAFQSNRNILLSDLATVNAKPQLEIWADDVKCSHGATSGQLSEEELFYLRSRGIGKEKAKAILVYAFASEVISHLDSEPLREHINRLLSERPGIEY